MTNKTEAGTIDLTPTWSGILPALLLALTEGTEEGQKIARQELERMARVADAAVDLAHPKDPEPEDDNPFHPESPEGRAWEREHGA